MPGIVINSLKVVYWPIPKNACTAIKSRIAEIEGLPKETPGFPHQAPFQWTEGSIDGYQDFAVVRNPLGRLYSLWVNKIAAKHPIGARYQHGMDVDVFGHHLDRFRTEMPFPEFVKSINDIPKDHADPHWAPQVTQMPKDAKFIRLEDMSPLLEIILPRLNQSRYEVPWQHAYSDDALTLARFYYWEDRERFRYDGF